MLLVLPPPGAQLGLHGVHVLLDVVHDLAQRQRVAAHRLNGRAKALNLPRHKVPLLVARHLRHHVLERGGGDKQGDSCCSNVWRLGLGLGQRLGNQELGAHLICGFVPTDQNLSRHGQKMICGFICLASTKPDIKSCRNTRKNHLCVHRPKHNKPTLGNVPFASSVSNGHSQSRAAFSGLGFQGWKRWGGILQPTWLYI